MLMLFTLFGCSDWGDPGCEAAEGLPEAEIVAVGDSMFDWIGGCGDAPVQAGLSMGERVENEAVAGAVMIEEIPSQYPSGDWRWVIADGGGNDMECEGDECDARIDAVEDAWRELADAVEADGAQLAVVGYPNFREDAESYALWEAQGDALMDALQRVADDYEGAHFVDLRPVIDGAVNPEYFDEDGLHPSEEGARVMAGVIAEVIVTND